MPAASTSASLSELALAQFPLPVVLLDLKRRVVQANGAATVVLRSSPEQLLGKDLTEVIRAEDPTWCSIDPVDRLGSPRAGRTLKARVGQARRLLKVGVFPVRSEEEDVGMMVTVRDARAADPEPHEERDNLTSLGELSAIVAHEIRNPLTGIRTTVQFVVSKLEETDTRRGDLREVIQEIDRIEQIIENLLLFARPMEGKKALTDLNEVIVRAMDSMESQLSEAEIDVKRNLSPDLPPFVFSPDGMQQVLLNLLRNATEAMPQGGRLKVTSTLRKFRSGRPPAAEIFVSDTGHGIPEDVLGNIFKPFFTTRHNGTGLGLPISHGIVRSHGGRMYARNRIPAGATFRISLPLADPVEPKA